MEGATATITGNKFYISQPPDLVDVSSDPRKNAVRIHVSGLSAGFQV
jgi:hypothetical protein